jgi:hypothetical protein
MDGGKHLHGLQLDHELLAYQKIQPCVPNPLSRILRADRYLSAKLNAGSVSSTHSASSFTDSRKPGPRNAMHLDAAPMTRCASPSSSTLGSTLTQCLATSASWRFTLFRRHSRARSSFAIICGRRLSACRRAGWARLARVLREQVAGSAQLPAWLASSAAVGAACVSPWAPPLARPEWPSVGS